MLYTTLELGMAVRNGTVEQHPMFCYDGVAAGQGSTHQSSGPEVMLPANQPRSAQV